MAVFTIAFFMQWWGKTIIYFMPIVRGKVPMVIVTVITANLGGLFNGLAYSIIRKQKMRT